MRNIAALHVGTVAWIFKIGFIIFGRVVFDIGFILLVTHIFVLGVLANDV